jgi:hypothetical protein
MSCEVLDVVEGDMTVWGREEGGTETRTEGERMCEFECVRCGILRGSGALSCDYREDILLELVSLELARRDEGRHEVDEE